MLFKIESRIHGSEVFKWITDLNAIYIFHANFLKHILQRFVEIHRWQLSTCKIRTIIETEGEEQEGRWRFLLTAKNPSYSITVHIISLKVQLINSTNRIDLFGFPLKSEQANRWVSLWQFRNHYRGINNEV